MSNPRSQGHNHVTRQLGPQGLKTPRTRTACKMNIKILCDILPVIKAVVKIFRNVKNLKYREKMNVLRRIK